MNRVCLFVQHLLLLAFPLCFGQAPALGVETPMERSWEHLEEAFKKLKDGLAEPKDSKKAQYLKQAAIIKEEGIRIASLSPKLVATLPQDQQKTLLEEFLAEMKQFNEKVEAMISALDASDWAKARQLQAELGKTKLPAHKKFRGPAYQKG